MYLYGLGVYDASRSEWPCSHLKTVSMDAKKTNLAPWWCEEKGKKSFLGNKSFFKREDEEEPDRIKTKWPIEPSKGVTFQQVHEYRPDAPFCTYLMMHPVTVSASTVFTRFVPHPRIVPHCSTI